MVVSITNRKGGTGKSTTAVNLAAELAANYGKTLLIDLDTQGHASIGVGVRASKQTKTIHQIFRDHSLLLSDCIVKTQWDNLLVCPADPLFEHGQIRERSILKERLQEAIRQEAIDFVVLDTPPSLDNLLLNALVASHYVLAPFIPHYLSLEGVRSLARVFFKVTAIDNPNLRLLGLLPVMINQRIQQHRRVTESIANQFGLNRVFEGIRADIRLVEAFEQQRPVRYYAPDSRGAEDYNRLTRQLIMTLSSVRE
jgi:chromosome partitioning protein